MLVKRWLQKKKKKKGSTVQFWECILPLEGPPLDGMVKRRIASQPSSFSPLPPLLFSCLTCLYVYILIESKWLIVMRKKCKIYINIKNNNNKKKSEQNIYHKLCLYIYIYIISCYIKMAPI